MKIVFRGDLNTNNGYSKAIRAYASVCNSFGDIEGIPIHQGPRDEALWEFPICDETGLFLPTKQAKATPTVVVQVCTPDHYIRYPNAINVGCFFWESSTIPVTFEWVAGLSSVDWLWLPASFMTKIPALEALSRKIVVPWPIMQSEGFTKADNRGTLPNLISVDCNGVCKQHTAHEVRRRFPLTYLSISSVAARKGVPGLIRAWLANEVDGALILRLSLKHFSLPHSNIQEYLKQVGLDGQELKRVFFMLDEVPEESMAELYGLADYYITNTYGEGFGGPVAEAILKGIPVISPVHTGLEDLLPESHVLRVPHTASRINLLGNLPNYSCNTEWYIPDMDFLTGVIRSAATLTLGQRKDIAKSQLRHFSRFNSKECIRNTLEKWIGEQ